MNLLKQVSYNITIKKPLISQWFFNLLYIPSLIGWIIRQNCHT